MVDVVSGSHISLFNVLKGRFDAFACLQIFTAAYRDLTQLRASSAGA